MRRKGALSCYAVEKPHLWLHVTEKKKLLLQLDLFRCNDPLLFSLLLFLPFSLPPLSIYLRLFHFCRSCLHKDQFSFVFHEPKLPLSYKTPPYKVHLRKLSLSYLLGHLLFFFFFAVLQRSPLDVFFFYLLASILPELWLFVFPSLFPACFFFFFSLSLLSAD